jgi:hypothetical protein
MGQSYDFGIYKYNANVVGSRLQRAFFKVKENILNFKTPLATRGVVNFYNGRS